MAKISEIVMRESKNRNKRPKLVSVANARILPKVEGERDVDQNKSPGSLPGVSPNARSIVSPTAHISPSSFQRETSSSSISELKRPAPSDDDYNDNIETIWPTQINEQPQQTFFGDFASRQFQSANTGQQQHWLARQVTGIPPDLELKLLDEYMDLVYYQLPVFDSDQVYMRYKFCFPTPMPTFLLKTLIALGAAYTCRRPPAQAIVNSIQARRLYDDARTCILRDCLHDMSIDAIAALMLITFHWQDELTSKEREQIFSLSISKVQALQLHLNEGLLAQRTRREIGQLKLMVWINYVMDAFSILLDLDNFHTKDKWMSVSYLHNEPTIGPVDETDLEFMHIDLLTGKRKESSLSTEVGIFGAIVYFEAIIGISRIMNEAQRMKDRALSLAPLVPEIRNIESTSFSILDFRSMVVEMMDGMYKGLISLNFTFWYTVLFISFDAFLPIIKKRPKTPGSSGTPELASQMSFKEQVEQRGDLLESIECCVEASIAMLDIFEKLQRNGLLAQTSQIVREQLYLGGYAIQLFYRERVGGVDNALLGRWESCLEISELVWGFSSRGGDLDRMRLEELD